MSYNPSIHETLGKSLGLYDSRTSDARSYFYDELTYSYRPYSSKQEVYDYLIPQSIRNGHFPVFILESGEVNIYFFKDGTDDSDLVPYDEYITSGDFDLGTYVLTLLSNRGRSVEIDTKLGDVLSEFFKEATYDSSTTTLSLVREDGSTVDIQLNLSQRDPKMEWYPLGEKDNVNQIFKVSEPYIPSKTKCWVNGNLQHYGENYIELDNGDNGEFQIFVPPEPTSFPVFEYYPRID